MNENEQDISTQNSGIRTQDVRNQNSEISNQQVSNQEPEQPKQEHIAKFEPVNPIFTPKKILPVLAILFLAAAIYALIPTKELPVTGQNTQDQHIMPIVPKEDMPQKNIEVEEITTSEPQKTESEIEPQKTPPPTDYIMTTDIRPFTLVSSEVNTDTFNKYTTQRYTGRYKSDKMPADVHVFKFENQEQTNNAVDLEFYTAKELGASTQLGNNVIIFLSKEGHRIVTWPSNDTLVYIDTPIPQYAALEVVQAYLRKYPSSLQSNKCVDSDGANKYNIGTTSRVEITNVTNGTTIRWTDTCLKDYQPYKDGHYTPERKTNERDGILEGECQKDKTRSGYITPYICPRGCENGQCKS